MIDDDIRIMSQWLDEGPREVQGTQGCVMGSPSEVCNPYSEMNMELKNSIDHVIGTHVFLMTIWNDEVVVGMPKKYVVLV